MKNLIENILEEKTKDKTSYILYNQWVYDKVLIPQALNSISNIFPHYSLHNVTHSETIIANIIKIVGEDNLELFTATDLWLILESCYSHDLGMVITAELINKAIENGEIVNHIRYLQSEPNHDLFEYATKLKIENGKIVYSSNRFTLEKTDIFRYILADYFRNHHGSITTQYLKNPSSIAVDSPRTIIPQRLYEILSKVCEAHSKNFDELFNLPIEEDGVDIDICHPRLIASLLRLGDLLDIDNGRFSMTDLKTLNSVPISTEYHQQKHMSIKHKSINSDKIELIAECYDKSVAIITQDWFDWINEEFANQSLAWNNIAPPYYNFSLPTVNQLKVDLKGYLDSGLKGRPKFTVDTSKALELLRGANFYESPLKAIRELIQNSIDSTLIRVWEENKLNINNLNDLVRVGQNYPISIRINSNDHGYTELIIEDSGTGISRDDLKFMASAGSSAKNFKKNNLIQEMPVWMQPAGYFGIGFHSSFLLSDLVEITTYSMFSNEKYTIEFHSPDSKFKGNIYIKEIENFKERIKPGSSIKIVIEDTRVFDSLNSTNITKNLKINHSFAYHGLMEQLRELGNFSFFPITVNGSKIDRHKFDFLSSSGIEISYFPENPGCKIYFKNSVIHGFNFRHFRGVINYHSHDSSILNISRKDFRKNSLHIVKNDIIDAFIEFHEQKTEKDALLDVIKYLNSNDYGEQTKLLVQNQGFVLNASENKILIKSIIDLKTIVIRFNTTFYPSLVVSLNQDELLIESSHIQDNNIILDLLIRELGQSHANVTYTGYRKIKQDFSYHFQTEVTFSKEKIDNKITLKEIVEISQNQFTPNRLTYLPALKKYENLYMKSELDGEASIIYGQDIRIPFLCILSPLIRVTKDYWVEIDDDAFFDLVKNQLLNTDVELSEIKASYGELKQEMWDEINKVPPLGNK